MTLEQPVVSNLELKLKKNSSLIDEKIEQLLPQIPHNDGGMLIEAIRYMALSPGKRIRGFLVIEISKLFFVKVEDSLPFAVVIELIHTYSLVHDDLPSMDNDDYRRGQLSCHKKYGEAIAILTGNALLTYAFEILTKKNISVGSEVIIKILKVISRSIGFNGMLGGQALDILSENKKLELSEVLKLQKMKTGDLFFAACMTGAILGGADKKQMSAIENFSEKIGLAFQITDDLLDVYSEEGNKTLIPHFGHKKALEYAKNLINLAINEISIFKDKSHILKELAQFIFQRKK